MNPNHARRLTVPAFARSWNIAKKPTIVAASVT
jgi:hypothetical protein